MKYQMRILVADRNPHIRSFLKRELTSQGYQVQLARNGRELRSIVGKDGHLDLLILDLDMPTVDGPEILHQLKGRLPPLPVIVYAFLEGDGYRPFLQCAAFVEKRGDIEELKRAVEKVMCSRYRYKSDPSETML